MSLNAIGNQNFTILLGNPQSIAERVEVITRPGVDGFGVRRLGRRGEPFELLSKTDFATGVIGRLIFEQYVKMIADDKHHLRWEGIDFTPKVIVLDVTQERLKVVTSITGGINVAQGGSGAILEAKWTLAFIN